MSNRSLVKPPINWSSNITIGLLVVVIIMVGIGFWGNFTEGGKSAFANIKSRFTNTGSGGLKDLEIIMFMSPTCPWCKKMLGVLEKEGQIRNITIVDMTKPEGASMAKQFGADKQPVPSFISRKLKTGTVGYRESVSKLLESLKTPEGPKGPNKSEGPSRPEESEGGSNGSVKDIAQQLQIILFAREGCGYCTKAKENLSETGIVDVIQVVDITTPEGAQMAGQVLPPGSSGVPAWVSMTTKKSVIGFKPIEQIVQELQ
jgi:glutaredoxin